MRCNSIIGTGAVKITPAHDPIDYACGQRHNLPVIEILNEDGTIVSLKSDDTCDTVKAKFDTRLKYPVFKLCYQNDKCGYENFVGQHRFKVRNEIITMLKEKGLYHESKSYPSNVFR